MNAAEIDRNDFPAGETMTATITAEDNANLASDLVTEDIASFNAEVKKGADLGFEGD